MFFVRIARKENTILPSGALGLKKVKKLKFNVEKNQNILNLEE